jgi:hypothetical protein
MRRTALTLLAAAMASIPAPATNAMGAEPLIVRAAARTAAAVCAGNGGRGGTGPSAVRQVTLGRFGTTAWVIDYLGYCKGRGGDFCGPLGCKLEVFLPDSKKGFQAAFEGRVKAWRVRTSGGKTRFEIARAAAYCGLVGKSGCTETYEPSNGTLVLVAKGTHEFARDSEPRLAGPVRSRLVPGQTGEGPTILEPGPLSAEDLKPGGAVAFPVSPERLEEIRSRQKRLNLPVR